MAVRNPPPGKGWSVPHLNIVLIGGRNSGKSSVGNLLLGKEEFVTKERTCCSRRVGMTGAQWLTVVDTPGWWCDLSSRDTSELVKREILSSVALCSPGPHAFLVVVKASSAFTERRRAAVEEHVELIGGTVWDHCVLVVAFTDAWRLTEAEEHVRRGGKALQWLRDKCGRRCHSVVIDDGARVDGLLAEIRRMAAENECTFEMSGEISQRVTDEARRIEARAHRRFVNMKKTRAVQREKSRPMTDIRIVLLGAKGSGKSSVFKTILGINQESRERARTIRNHVGNASVFGRHLTVVDTPGWWCNYFCDETTNFDKREMVLSLSRCPPGPHAFLLVIRVDRAFRDTHRRSVEEHIRLIDDRIWHRVMVLFSFGDWLGSTTTEQFIESEGEPLQRVVDRCRNRYHVLNNRTKGDGFQVRELIGKLEEMVATSDRDWYFEIEGGVVRSLEQRMREESDRARGRTAAKVEQRRTAGATLENFAPLSDLNIVLLGASKTGKSSCGNTILARDCLRSATPCSSSGRVSGRMVTVLDTPGSFCATSRLCKTSSAFLLVVNVTSAFGRAHLKMMEDRLPGDAWSKAMVLFSFGDWIGDATVEQRIESEGRHLQRLIERCGGRYHVLDNKKTCRAQVDELLRLVEETTAEERLASFQDGDRFSMSIPQTQERGPMRISEAEDVCQLQASASPPRSGGATPPPTAPASSQIIPLSERTRGTRSGLTRRHFLSFPGSAPNGKSRLFWTEGGQMTAVNLPVWRFAEYLPENMTWQSERASRSSVVLFLPHAQSVHEDAVNPARALCHPALVDRTLKRLAEHGGLQSLIDQWGDSSLEELEAFIDLYFETLWERTMGSCQAGEQQDPATEEPEVEEGVLTNINRMLTKLDALEEIREDLSVLRRSVEQCVGFIDELRGNTNT